MASSFVEFTNSLTGNTATINTAQISAISITSSGEADIHVVGQDRPVHVTQPYADVVAAVKAASEPTP